MLVRGDPDSADGAKFPEFFPAIAELTAAQGDNGVGSVDGPTHSRLLQPLADYRLAAGFGNARADKQTLATKLCVAHPFRVGLKVVDGFADFFSGLVFAGS